MEVIINVIPSPSPQTSCLNINEDLGQITITDPSSLTSTSNKLKDDSVKTFKFNNDSIYDLQSKSTSELSKNVTQTLLKRCIENLNSSCIVTGTGGKATLHSDDDGLIPTFVKSYFKSDEHCAIVMGIIMIYDEDIYDLLSPLPFNSSNGSSKLHYSSSVGTYVDNQTFTTFTSKKNLLNQYNSALSYHAYLLSSSNKYEDAGTLLISFQKLYPDKTAGGKVTFVEISSFDTSPDTDSSGDGELETDRLSNQSKLSLGLSEFRNCVSALAFDSKNVSFRGASLTWLLRECLLDQIQIRPDDDDDDEDGGDDSYENDAHKTIIVGCINPPKEDYDETLNTLRLMDKAKIYNMKVENSKSESKTQIEASNVKKPTDLVKQLQKEIDGLSLSDKDKKDDRISSLQLLKTFYATSIKQLEIDTEKMKNDRESMCLRKYNFQTKTKKDEPYPCLVRLTDDLFFTNRVRHSLQIGRNVIGRSDASTQIDLKLNGAGVSRKHCVITVSDNGISIGKEKGALVLVNGDQIYDDDVDVKHGDVIEIGVCYRFMMFERNEGGSDLLPTSSSIISNNSRIDNAVTKFISEHDDRIWFKSANLKLKFIKEIGRVKKVIKLIEDNDHPYIIAHPNIDTAKLAINIEKYGNEIATLDAYKDEHVAVCRGEVTRMYDFLSEANEIGSELEKVLLFDLTLVSSESDDKEEEEEVEDAYLSIEEIIKSAMGGISVKETKSCSLLPAKFTVTVTNTTGESPNEFWSINKFMNRLHLIRGMWASYITCNRDLVKLLKIKPPSIDPFYEPPIDKLIGVAYCFLDSLTYLIELHESCKAVAFRGGVVGGVDVVVLSSLKNNAETKQEKRTKIGDVPFTASEFVIGDHVGEIMSISLCVKCVKDLPRNCCSGCFVSFPFFTESQPFTTTRCPKTTTSPYFNETFSVHQVITEDFIDYLAHNALELEIWGSPQSLIDDPNDALNCKYIVGEVIAADLHAGEGGDDVGKVVDLGFLSRRLDEVQQELNVEREVAKQVKGLNDAERRRVELEGQEVRGKMVRKIEELKEGMEAEREKMKVEFELEILRVTGKKSKVCVVS